MVRLGMVIALGLVAGGAVPGTAEAAPGEVFALGPGGGAAADAQAVWQFAPGVAPRRRSPVLAGRGRAFAVARSVAVTSDGAGRATGFVVRCRTTRLAGCDLYRFPVGRHGLRLDARSRRTWSERAVAASGARVAVARQRHNEAEVVVFDASRRVASFGRGEPAGSAVRGDALLVAPDGATWFVWHRASTAQDCPVGSWERGRDLLVRLDPSTGQARVLTTRCSALGSASGSPLQLFAVTPTSGAIVGIDPLRDSTACAVALTSAGAVTGIGWMANIINVLLPPSGTDAAPDGSVAFAASVSGAALRVVLWSPAVIAGVRGVRPRLYEVPDVTFTAPSEVDAAQTACSSALLGDAPLPSRT